MFLSSRFFIWNRRLHRWCSYVLAVPVIFWFASGLVMSWSPIHVVRGEHNQAHPSPAAFDAGGALPVTAGYGAIRSLSARQVGPRILLHGVFEDGTERLIDAESGTVLDRLDKAGAIAVAEADFAPEAMVLDAEFLTGQAPTDYRRRMPVWRVRFDDPEGTILYVDPLSARVTARRTDHWRVFDFFWMLHILDFDTRDNINTPLLKTGSLVAVVFTLTGLVLILQHLLTGRVRMVRKKAAPD